MATRLTVTSAETTPSGLRRVWFRSDDLSAFADSHHTDRYVKLVLPRPGVAYPAPLEELDLRALRTTMAPEDLPVVRTYTALFPDVVAGTLAIDFVVHGDEGVAGPWAASAASGDTLVVNGPGGAWSPDPTADWHLLVGDESALPAVTAALAVLPPDAVVRVVVLVESPAHLPRLDPGERGELVVAHRSDGGTLEAAVRSLDWPPGRVSAFVHGEAGEVMRRLRPHLLGERGVDRADLSISGYWRRGRTEEGFREWKQAQPRD